MCDVPYVILIYWVIGLLMFGRVILPKFYQGAGKFVSIQSVSLNKSSSEKSQIQNQHKIQVGVIATSNNTDNNNDNFSDENDNNKRNDNNNNTINDNISNNNNTK